MKCPFCAEEILSDAIVCKHCHRDFYVVHDMVTKLDAASTRIAALEARLSDLGVSVEDDGTSTRTAEQRSAIQDAAVLYTSLSPLSAALLCLFGLVIAHLLIIMTFDLPLIYLRGASIALPLVFGFLCRPSFNRGLLLHLAIGFAVAVIAIFIMTLLVSRADHIAALPLDAASWRENAQYAASISFSFFAGSIIRHGLLAARVTGPRVSFASALLGHFLSRRSKRPQRESVSVGEQVREIEKLVSGAVALASLAVSIVTGLAGVRH